MKRHSIAAKIETVLAILLIAALAAFCAPRAKADETSTSISQSYTSNSFATGMIVFRDHGSIGIDAGYSGKVNGTPAYAFGNFSAQLNAFVGVGAVTNSGDTTAGVALYPSLSYGSLNLGAGGYYGLDDKVFRGCLTVSVSFN